MYAYTNIYSQMFSSFNYYNPKLKNTPMSINRGMDQEIIVYSYKRIILSNKNK